VWGRDVLVFVGKAREKRGRVGVGLGGPPSHVQADVAPSGIVLVGCGDVDSEKGRIAGVRFAVGVVFHEAYRAPGHFCGPVLEGVELVVGGVL